MKTTTIRDKWLKSQEALAEAIKAKDAAKRRLSKHANRLGIDVFDAKVIAGFYREFEQACQHLDRQRRKTTALYKAMKESE